MGPYRGMFCVQVLAMSPIVLWPTLGAALIAVIGILMALKPDAAKDWAQRFRRGPLISRVSDRFSDQRDHLVDGLGSGIAFVLLVSVSIPPIVVVCFVAGVLVTSAPVWAHDGSLFHWFMREGPEAPSLLQFLRGVSKLGEWTPVLVISGVASLGLFLIAKERRWLAPVLVATAVVVERDVQKTITWFVNQPPNPTTSAGFPSGGVARVIAIYGFIAYLYLRLRNRHSWSSAVIVWTLIALFAFLMGYARAALLLHWPFDIPGGWLLGVLLLSMMMAASTVFDGSFFPPRNSSPSDHNTG